jgi:thiosulfate/3-mercaptopyruvate sulfurtransferase
MRGLGLALALAVALATATPSARAGYAHPEILVDTTWLAAHAKDAGVRIVDMRTSGFAQGHIPGAVHLDNGPIRTNEGPTFLPTETDFARLMAGLGISDGTRVIVYDDRGGIYAARLWFVLRAFGHPNAALLDGGWTKWTLDKRPTSTDAAPPAPGTFHAKLDRTWVATADDVMAAIKASGTKIVDARTQGEIDGKDLRGIKNGGKIPASVPVYWEDALNMDTRTFKSADDIAALYRSKGVSAADKVITYCQIGMRASHDLFTLTLIGQTNVRVYYGSWDEWGNRSDLPIAKGGGSNR